MQRRNIYIISVAQGHQGISRVKRNRICSMDWHRHWVSGRGWIKNTILWCILTAFFLWYSIKMVLIRSFSWNKMSMLLVCVILVCAFVWNGARGFTIWLEGRELRFCIISSISSNFLAIAWTSACSSLYSAYWSLNTALYWSLSSSERMLGYFLWKQDRRQHIFLGPWLHSHCSWMCLSLLAAGLQDDGINYPQICCGYSCFSEFPE